MNDDLGKTIRDENDRLCQIAEKEVDKYWRDACDKFKFLGIVLDHIKSQIQIGRSNIKYLVLRDIAHNASSLGSDIHHNLKQGRFDAVFRLCRTLEEYEIQAGFIAKGDNERAEKFIKQRNINELKKLAVFFPTKPKSWHLPNPKNS